MQQPLVSVCSPCYNVAPFIGQFLDSMMAQTYKHLELILVDDGSVDDTGKIIAEYTPRLEAAGFIVKYIRQENKGLSGAINTGIKHINGKYFIWPDPDDWQSPDSIEVRVKFMEDHPSVGLVRGNMQKVRASDGSVLRTVSDPSLPPYEVKNLADKLIMQQIYIENVASMIRSSAFFSIYKDREIFTTRYGGQNYQLVIPVAAKFESWQLPKILGKYIIRADSHSRTLGYENKLRLNESSRETMLNVLKLIPSLWNKYSDKVKMRFYMWEIDFAFSNGDYATVCRLGKEALRLPLQSITKWELFYWIKLASKARYKKYLQTCRQKHRPMDRYFRAKMWVKSTEYKLFSFLPLVQIRTKATREEIRLFRFLPIMRIKVYGSVRKYNLFGFIPFMKRKEKELPPYY